MSDSLLPKGWMKPRGYAHGMVAQGRIVTVAGQIGWNPLTSEFESDDFVEQTHQALKNVVAVLKAGHAMPKHVVRLTWYITDRDAYLSKLAEVGRAYRAEFGQHYPAMTLVVVAGLLEKRAKVEIEATAVVPAR
jgi:enamine deaminase RidA (YjgF/YER057c/UK114 family)